MIAVLFALATALANAIAVATQHVASTATPQARGWRLVRNVVRHPLWMVGWLALGGSLVFQALALHFGPLSLVQPMLVSELVMALVLRRLWIRQSIRPVTWAAAAVTATALAGLLIVTAPRGSPRVPATRDWIAPVLVCLLAAGLLAVVARRGTPGRRAGLFATATAVLWALEATFIKATTTTLLAHGVSGMLSRWPVYALAVGGLAGLACEQAALHVGPLRTSQTFIVIVDPFVSIALGFWLYGEHWRGGATVDVAGVALLLVLSTAAAVLIATAPETMQASTHRV